MVWALISRDAKGQGYTKNIRSSPKFYTRIGIEIPFAYKFRLQRPLESKEAVIQVLIRHPGWSKRQALKSQGPTVDGLTVSESGQSPFT